jgi:hypothetical protein
VTIKLRTFKVTNRVCARCGRVGSRGFRHTLKGDYVCASVTACENRQYQAHRREEAERTWWK